MDLSEHGFRVADTAPYGMPQCHCTYRHIGISLCNEGAKYDVSSVIPHFKQGDEYQQS